MFPVGVNVPLSGSKSSALASEWQQSLTPPAINTLPFRRSVGVCPEARGVARVPEGMNVPEAWAAAARVWFNRSKSRSQFAKRDLHVRVTVNFILLPLKTNQLVFIQNRSF